MLTKVQYPSFPFLQVSYCILGVLFNLNLQIQREMHIIYRKNKQNIKRKQNETKSSLDHQVTPHLTSSHMKQQVTAQPTDPTRWSWYDDSLERILQVTGMTLIPPSQSSLNHNHHHHDYDYDHDHDHDHDHHHHHHHHHHVTKVIITWSLVILNLF